ncbi:NAD(P)-dependent dehydrogenase (short-subunit alcohol dehydrogenase family) [Granulicella aggregans]|uniref:NAD(P)-dependent dehydrogenase (Short-subunit alcohol dehydrogenase family) n=1 Tax=Granulicella aggregans TaxID=474949 RepID=A0A7W7ZJN0_9BACT|nr:SDR family oxidoreductase [Granulicella aggregans]MBB5061103.1 NAD(P)-dependent dehydrogenase (short-subunit alcohol dehydrogenase family) [Granulicella aggregans]
MKRLAEKVILIMGATRGIGQTCAEMFAKEGASVILTGRDVDRGEAVAKGILDTEGAAQFLACDVTEPQSVENVVDETLKRFGAIDVLINSAGGSGNSDGPVTTGSIEEFWHKLRVDHFGTYLAMRYVIPSMIERGGGSVINIVSVAGFGKLTGERAGYSAAKAAVINLTRSTARTFAKDRVRVNAIAPAGVATERIKRMLLDRPEAQALVATQQFGLIDPKDIAYAALFLASDEARMITGHILPVDAASFAD